MDIVLFAFINRDVDMESRRQSNLKYIESYNKKINKIVKKADIMLGTELFGDSQTAAYYNIVKTKNDYKRVADIQIQEEHDIVTELVADFKYAMIFVWIIMLYILYELCKERKNGLQEMTYATKNGRKKIALKRAVFFVVLSIVSMAIITVINICVAGTMYGFDNFDGPIQTIESFGEYTNVCSKSKYLALMVIKYGLLCAALVMIAFVLSNLFYNINVSLLLYGGLLVGQWWLYNKIANNSKYVFFKYANVYSFFELSKIERVYMNVQVGNNFYSNDLIVFLCGIIILLLMFVFSILTYRKIMPTQNMIIKRIIIMIEEKSQCVLSKLPLFLKEVWKVLWIKKGLLLILTSIVVVISVCKDTIVTFPSRQLDMDEVYKTYSGKDWTRFEEYVRKQQELYDSNIKQMNALQDTLNDENASINMAKIIKIQSSNVEIRERLLEYQEKIDLRDEIKSRYNIDTYVVTDRGYNEAIGENSKLREYICASILFVVVILMSLASFEMETDAKIWNIFVTTGNGSEYVLKQKLLVLCVIVTVFFLLIYGVDGYILYTTYDYYCFEAPIQSLKQFSNVNIDINIYQYIMLKYSFIYLYMDMFQKLTIYFTIGRKTKNRLYALLLMLLAIIIFIIMAKINIIIWIISVVFLLISNILLLYLIKDKCRYT